MQKRIYIDTTIPSTYYTLRTDAESLARQKETQHWWAKYADIFFVTSSTAVVVELSRGTREATQNRLDLLRGIHLFAVTSEIERIAQVYIDKLVMPQDPFGDALHLAIASFHKVDVLLTWNCMHLANPNKFDFITGINQRLGLSTPAFKTPLDYLGDIA